MHPRINSISGPHKLFWLGKNSFRQHQTAAATIVRPKVMHLVEQRPKKSPEKLMEAKMHRIMISLYIYIWPKSNNFSKVASGCVGIQ